ncbi:indole-3-glycerol phosphate synthase TrpC [Marinifilum caeruleilacunae]|uniref:indole-3-glycerol-phosphate synthase n=1 Tax=Marinifilum caeruleilacunae TaxID=2499076 RepID=A0ABX1WVP9_9BACT|nr:indole-3-glycerol phosphate synthase TrpC [Marinifilum caeruleilacunae]NOU60195.1 indole-3-glycerol phosphate synthase TrpC [Marinifilum caeruleilacunae]
MSAKQNILDRIVQKKLAEVAVQKMKQPIYQVMSEKNFKRKCYSAKESIRKAGASGVIAEFKRQSPSKGVINGTAKPNEVVGKYQKAGASMVSVLTDESFFGAKSEDFETARKTLQIPLLRKEFIVDPYQIYQSKAMGADVVLLIAAILTPQRCKDFAFLAKELGMEVLLELHDESELQHVNKFVDLVGINNRNLKTFAVDTDKSIQLAGKLPEDMIRVAESGLSSSGIVKEMRDKGFQAFLMGEYFMKQSSPGDACREFIKEIM